MKYNSIGEQLIAKAQELDPNYKPDKFNDMSEAINIILKNSGDGGGKSVSPTLNLVDLSGEVRTTITEEEKTNLENGLYNQVLFPGLIPDEAQVLMPSKLIGDKSFDIRTFIQFNCVISDDTAAINALSFYKYSLGEKDTSGNYPITITKLFDIPVGGSGVGGGNIWYNLGTISETITQDQYNEIKSLIDNKRLAGITVDIAEITTFAFPLMGINYGNTFVFGSTSVGTETDVYTKKSIDYITYTIKPDLSCKLD